MNEVNALTVNRLTDIESFISLLMALLFLAGLVTLFLPSAGGNGLRRYLIATMSTSALFFVLSAYPLFVSDILTSPATVWFVAARTVARVSMAISIILTGYKTIKESRTQPDPESRGVTPNGD